jgi:hypothetical protein
MTRFCLIDDAFSPPNITSNSNVITPYHNCADIYEHIFYSCPQCYRKLILMNKSKRKKKDKLIDLFILIFIFLLLTYTIFNEKI